MISMTAYYWKRVNIPPYFNSGVASGHPHHLYMWGQPQPMMHPYGPPYAPFYSHGGVYTHHAVVMEEDSKLKMFKKLWWLAFRDYEKSSATDYAKVASEKISKLFSWNSFERGQAMKRRRCFIIVLLKGYLIGLDYMHDHDKLHQCLGPFSISLKYVTSRPLVLFYVFHLDYISLSLYH
ncbi:unnamed protein product [Vicia faba]|uniref:G-box binding protein multifunctional mosaic region domain-containing protein n=1 Tax=Vicia faba TaxID=3906 RepID=A0AAV1B9Z3_VICFA|nr:unnamed protein product [Vicia faba]